MSAYGGCPLHSDLFDVVRQGWKGKILDRRKLLPTYAHAELRYHKLNTFDGNWLRSRVFEGKSKSGHFTDSRWVGIDAQAATGIGMSMHKTIKFDCLHAGFPFRWCT